MSWRPRVERILWYAAVVICSAGVLAWLRSIEIWYQYWSLPHSPNPATGHIYPLNIHGYVVYQTLKEQLRRERWEFWSLEVTAFGAALGAVHKWMAAKRERQ